MSALGSRTSGITCGVDASSLDAWSGHLMDSHIVVDGTGPSSYTITGITQLIIISLVGVHPYILFTIPSVI